MLDPQKLAPKREQKREELFTERYERLLAWALRLTNQHSASAEDLVQDAFIQFVLGRTRFEVEPELLSESQKDQGRCVKQPVDFIHPSPFIPNPSPVPSAY